MITQYMYNVCGSENDFVLSGTKSLPEPMLTQIYVTMSLGHNELPSNL